ncbi:alpha/beta hydrolase [Flavobacterium sp. F-65]|jgi:hypothetical protein|uniref:Alpha/beta hydrolase n=1 Tax=Flavobacterium pisciphilum TaxID=2893755 RepID=A0ABS8MT29_9FLAO|nr:alpha/beta hydrolase [Flavobacterium sp. F-65]MCC9071924.1 alpha/beta hydrolase [Flavobacterium sp. F-65]
MIKPRLIILSDLFGGVSPKWINYYIEIVESKFDIQYYDVLKLADIDVSDFDETSIHNQFLNGGIDKAVENLLNLEREKVVVLGFSIGGTIAWKSCLKGLKVDWLFTVSSTRLRFETEIPNCKIKMYFGEKDLNIPNTKWFLDLKVSNYIFENANHQLYLEEEKASLICSEILQVLD